MSRLTLEVRSLLEQNFPLIRVEGELSNLTLAASGHSYFTLKDDRAQVRCVLFRARGKLLRFVPENGDQVLLRVRVSFYEGRGEFQLLVEHMEAAGVGRLLQQLEERKAALQAEGLFDLARKQPLPAYPRVIGVVSSASGAAVRDVIITLGRRFPVAQVRVFPVAVQGVAAAAQIAAAIDLVSQHRFCDVLLVCRGGGSLEDLWAFNEESVARAIDRCRVPVITGIGHEIDTTIADLVADRRAATPTAAAELAVPDRLELEGHLQARVAGLMRGIGYRIMDRQQQLDRLRQRLVHPGEKLRNRRRELSLITRQLLWLMDGLLRQRRLALVRKGYRLTGRGPTSRLQSVSKDFQLLRQRLVSAAKMQWELLDRRFAANLASLNALSPLHTLARGYAIVRKKPHLSLVKETAQVQAGDLLQVRLADGVFDCEVRQVVAEKREQG